VIVRWCEHLKRTGLEAHSHEWNKQRSLNSFSHLWKFVIPRCSCKSRKRRRTKENKCNFVVRSDLSERSVAFHLGHFPFVKSIASLFEEGKKRRLPFSRLGLFAAVIDERLIRRFAIRGLVWKIKSAIVPLMRTYCFSDRACLADKRSNDSRPIRAPQ